MISYSCILGFMPNLHKKSWIVSIEYSACTRVCTVKSKSIATLISCPLFINVIGVLKLSLVKGLFFHQQSKRRNFDILKMIRMLDTNEIWTHIAQLVSLFSISLLILINKWVRIPEFGTQKYYLVQLIEQPILRIPNFNFPNLRCCKVFFSF